MTPTGRRRWRRGAYAVLVPVLAGLAALPPALDLVPPPIGRHVYVLSVLALALRFGLVTGGLAAGVTIMAQAPRWLSQLEAGGMTVSVVDELIGWLTLLGVATVVGVLTSSAQRQRRRYTTLRAVQHVVAEARPLPETLDRLQALLAERCGAAALSIVVRDADGLTVSGGDRLVPGSAVARALDAGTAVFASDTGTEPRPRRALAVPLRALEQVIGVLAVERVGELGAGERASLIDLGTSLGLALENARLADVNRRFNAELRDKVAAATQRLETLDRAKSTFVATASHELRTPLTALLGFSELLATRRIAEEEVARLAGIMRTESERLARIIDDLLDLSRIERGTALRVRPVPLAVRPALRAAVEVFQRPGVQHRIVVQAEDVWVHADPDALDRVVKNLVSNAIKYSPPGSAVTLSAQPRADGVEITIADEGTGIAPDALARIFEPYYRTVEATQTASGLGLGLAVVKALVEAQGGAIGAESAPGQGTRVRFSLPLRPTGASASLTLCIDDANLFWSCRGARSSLSEWPRRS
jgi:two-component system sensor histidine kinase KdpD